MRSSNNKCIGVSFFLLLNVGCAASLKNNNVKIDEISAAPQKKDAVVDAIEKTEVVVVSDQSSVEVFECRIPDLKNFALMINPDLQKFEQGVCKSEIAQAFLSKGFGVLALNRPGVGKSTPSSGDFSGPVTIKAVQKILQSRSSEKVAGIWASGSGVIAATLATKNLEMNEAGAAPVVSWLILGNGIYDLEDFAKNCSDSRYKDAMESAIGEKESLAAFNEARSIAWDTTGLVRHQFVYHGLDNKLVDIKQARSYRDALAAQEYKVELREVSGVGQDFLPFQERAIVEAALDSFHTAKD